MSDRILQNLERIRIPNSDGIRPAAYSFKEIVEGVGDFRIRLWDEATAAA
jgi:hypothetical protein